MIIKSIHRNARISAQKTRLVANQIRGLLVSEALNILTFSCKKASNIIKKVLLSAIANAVHNFNLKENDLKIKRIYIDKSTSFKRSVARAKGRSNYIEKQSCHITIIVGI